MWGRQSQTLKFLIVSLLLVAGVWLCLDAFTSEQNSYPAYLPETRAEQISKIRKLFLGIVSLSVGGLGLFTIFSESRPQTKRAWRTFGRRFVPWRKGIGKTFGLLNPTLQSNTQLSAKGRAAVTVKIIEPNAPKKTPGFSPPLIDSPRSKDKGRHKREYRKKEIGEEWKRLITQINALHADESDPIRKKQLGDIKTNLASSTARPIETARYWLSQARLISSIPREEKGQVTDSISFISIVSEKQILALLPIDDAVRAKRPDIDTDDVKRLLSILIAPGSDHPHFGDNTISYAELYKSALGKGMSSSSFEICFAWLASNSMPVIVDIKAAAIRRRRNRGNCRYVLNKNHKEVPPPGNEIIKIAIRARQRLVRMTKGRS